MSYMIEFEKRDAMELNKHLEKGLMHLGKAMQIAEDMCESAEEGGGMGERRYGSRSRYGSRYGGRYGNRDMDNLGEELNDMEDVAPGDEMGERRGRYGGRSSRSRIYY